MQCVTWEIYSIYTSVNMHVCTLDIHIRAIAKNGIKKCHSVTYMFLRSILSMSQWVRHAPNNLMLRNLSATAFRLDNRKKLNHVSTSKPRELGKHLNWSVMRAYGGKSYYDQLKSLQFGPRSLDDLSQKWDTRIVRPTETSWCIWMWVVWSTVLFEHCGKSVPS